MPNAAAPRCTAQARIDDFTVEVDPQQLPGGSRLFVVRGTALERFAQVRVCVCVCVRAHVLVSPPVQVLHCPEWSTRMWLHGTAAQQNG